MLGVAIMYAGVCIILTSIW